MTKDFDTIDVGFECRACGSYFAVPYRQLRRETIAECPCGTVATLTGGFEFAATQNSLPGADLIELEI